MIRLEEINRVFYSKPAAKELAYSLADLNYCGDLEKLGAVRTLKSVIGSALIAAINAIHSEDGVTPEELNWLVGGGGFVIDEDGEVRSPVAPHDE